MGNYDRGEVWGRGDGICPLCGIRMAKDNGVNGEFAAWQVDHSNPQNRGGTDSHRNTNAICAKCNRKKSDKYRSLSQARNDTQARTTGGRIIDEINKFKKEDSMLRGLSDIPDGALGASRKRFWKKK
jgi:hypothetical protein